MPTQPSSPCLATSLIRGGYGPYKTVPVSLYLLRYFIFYPLVSSFNTTHIEILSKNILWVMNSYSHFQVISRILNTLCKLRIHEGFTFAHSSNGIQNMVVEVAMEQQEEGQLVTGDSPTCVLQYIIFPPHTTSSGKSSPRASKKTCIEN